MKTIKEKIKGLKVGNKVVIYEPKSERFTPREDVIIKKGRQYFHLEKDPFRYSIDLGISDFCGYYIFPVTMEEYNEYINSEPLRRELTDIVKYYINDFDKTQLLELIDKIKTNFSNE